MKKKIIIGMVLMLIIIVTLSGCTRQAIPTTYEISGRLKNVMKSTDSYWDYTITLYLNGIIVINLDTSKGADWETYLRENCLEQNITITIEKRGDYRRILSVWVDEGRS